MWLNLKAAAERERWLQTPSWLAKIWVGLILRIKACPSLIYKLDASKIESNWRTESNRSNSVKMTRLFDQNNLIWLRILKIKINFDRYRFWQKKFGPKRIDQTFTYFNIVFYLLCLFILNTKYTITKNVIHPRYYKLYHLSLNTSIFYVVFY